jgi:hypothetical protein
MEESGVVFGFQEEWNDFRIRNPRFEEIFPRLSQLRSQVFEREFISSNPMERFVMLYGRMCMEEYYEILLMAGNGYGIGAQKLLRGFWEKAVTLEHLIAHPEEFDDFVDYHHVADYKLFKSVQEILGPDLLPAAIIEENAAEYDRVKERFMISLCKNCGTRRLNHSWNKLDIVSMSKKTRMLGKIVNEAYIIPLRHTHSTASSFVMRLEKGTDSHTLSFNPDAQRKEADSALRTAHLIVLEILDIQIKYYKLDALHGALDACEKDWIAIYRHRGSPGPEDNSI